MLHNIIKTFRLITGLLLINFFTFGNMTFAALPYNYHNLSALEKQTILWDNITLSYQQNGMPNNSQSGWSVALKKIKAIFSLKTTFDHVNDEISNGRIKFIHEKGSVGKIRFEPTANHPFTGIYQSGGIGLARLSLAVAPDNTSFTPGLALKFFVDNQPSLNTVAMFSLSGQGNNWNFFANNFTTTIDKANSFTLKILECIFEWTRKPANDLPIYHLAGVDTNGNKVTAPISPRMLVLKPADTVKSIIDPSDRTDFRESLLAIPAGPMYEVYGSLHGKEFHIGSIVLDSSLVASDYGDKQLFFQHKR